MLSSSENFDRNTIDRRLDDLELSFQTKRLFLKRDTRGVFAFIVATILKGEAVEFLYRFLPLGDNATPTAKDELSFYLR